MTRPSLPLALTLDGAPISSSTTSQWFGANVLNVATVIPRPGLPVTLTSSYVGTGRARTHVTHLQQGPAGPPTIEALALHDGTDEETSKVLYRPAECLDDHAQRLLSWLQALGHDAVIDIGDDADAVLQSPH
jgi:hypothetical protein